MEKSKFKDPRSVMKGFGSVLLGIAAYCVLVAPIFKEGSYREVVTETFLNVGLGFGITIVVIAAIWLGVLALMRRSQQ